MGQEGDTMVIITYVTTCHTVKALWSDNVHAAGCLVPWLIFCPVQKLSVGMQYCFVQLLCLM